MPGEGPGLEELGGREDWHLLAEDFGGAGGDDVVDVVGPGPRDGGRGVGGGGAKRRNIEHGIRCMGEVLRVAMAGRRGMQHILKKCVDYQVPFVQVMVTSRAAFMRTDPNLLVFWQGLSVISNRLNEN